MDFLKLKVGQKTIIFGVVKTTAIEKLAN